MCSGGSLVCPRGMLQSDIHGGAQRDVGSMWSVESSRLAMETLKRKNCAGSTSYKESQLQKGARIKVEFQ